eukprot:gene4973-6060_t
MGMVSRAIGRNAMFQSRAAVQLSKQRVCVSARADKEGLRLDKCLTVAGLSRQGAAEVLKEERVCVNGTIVRKATVRVLPGDQVSLDSKLLQWEALLQ